MSEENQIPLIIATSCIIGFALLLFFIWALVHDNQQTEREAIKQGYIEVQNSGTGCHWEKLKQ